LRASRDGAKSRARSSRSTATRRASRRRVSAATRDGVAFVVGDVMTHPFEPGSFDVVGSVAALHQTDSASALERMADLLRPRGVLAIVGLARGRYRADLPRDLAAVFADRLWKPRRSHWESSAPTIWPPAETYGEVRVIAERTQPRAVLRRHLRRYPVIWTKPAARRRPCSHRRQRRAARSS